MITDQELAELFKTFVIPAYKQCIEEIRGKDYKEAYSICFDNKTHHGVCCFLHCHKNVDVSEKGLVKYYGYFWAYTPFQANTTDQIISLHEKRISIMQEIINKVESGSIKP